MNAVMSLLRLPRFGGIMANSWRSLYTRPQLPSTLDNALQPSSVYALVGRSGLTHSRGLLASFGGLIGSVSVRTNVRNHFPKPREIKRIKTHGWRKRMSTLPGRRILMNRILKGRHVYSH